MVFHSLKVNRMTDPMGIDRDRLSFSFLWEGEGGPCVCTVWEGDRIATQEKIYSGVEAGTGQALPMADIIMGERQPRGIF